MNTGWQCVAVTGWSEAQVACESSDFIRRQHEEYNNAAYMQLYLNIFTITKCKVVSAMASKQ